MRLGILMLILFALLFGSGYWYDAIGGACRVPVRYHIGTIDARFGTNETELRGIAESAARIWESELSKDLFVYDESGIPINLVFDERQENSVIESELRDDLEAKEGMNEEVARQYDRLIGEFRKLKRAYESRIVAYEADLREYNETVTEWNNKGGAPSSEMEELRREQEALEAEQATLRAEEDRLNRLVRDLNSLGARANTLITDYNAIVEEYNARVEEAGEFTQGDYTGTAISVYEFNSDEELTLVLAHEFGHALDLDHVADPASIMYHFMKEQTIEKGIAPDDIREFDRVCGDVPPTLKLVRAVRNIF